MILRKKFGHIKLSTILSLIVFILIPPNYLMNFDFFYKINNFMLLGIFSLLFTLNIIYKKINLFIVIVFIFLSWNSLSSYFIVDGVLDFFNNIRILSIVLLINILIKNHTFSILRSLNLIFSIYILTNFLSYLLFPEGLYIDIPREGQYRLAWFLGIENQFNYILIPGVILSIVYSLYKYEKINIFSWFLLIISAITIYLSWSATAVVSILFVLLSLLLIKIPKLNKVYNFYSLIILYTITWFLIINISKHNFFQNFIEEFLKKDITLSSRTLIWDKVLEIIPYSFWYGFGNNTYVLVFRTKEFRAHNIILQIILDNGIISLFIFLLILIFVGIQIQKHNNTILKKVLIIGIIGILIGGMAESYKLNNLFLLLTLGYNLKYLSNIRAINDKRELNQENYLYNHSYKGRSV